MSAAPPAIVGTGFAVPPQVRRNDDPVFDWLRANAPHGAELFQGYDERRVLGPGETVTSIMAAAAEQALAGAHVGPGDVDVLLGYGSVAEYLTPNTLAEVHHVLGLGAHVPVIPLADDFTNFLSALVLADALVRTGQARTALLVCGDNWTRYVDLRTPQAISAGDGAGAAVVSAATAGGQFTLAGREHRTASDAYGAMYLAPDADGERFTAPTMHITPAGLQDFVSFGMGEAPQLVRALLDRHGLQPGEVTLICHQASATLIDAWRKALAPITVLDTLARYGNVVLAALPLTLAARIDEVATEHLVLLGLGVQLQACALLLTRQASVASASPMSSTLATAPHAT